MSAKGVLLSAGAGAIVTMAGVYLAKKVKRYLSAKPRMRLFHNNLLMSTRCAWLIAELGVEKDIDFRVIDRVDDPRYCSSDCLIMELESIAENKRHALHEKSVRQELDYQVVTYSPYVSREDLRTVAAPHDSDSNGDCGIYRGDDSASCAPSLVVNDEFTMIEGAAICMYLADLYGQFLPENEHRAEYYSWIVYSAATFDNIVKSLYHQMVELPESQRNRQILDSALGGFNAFARALNDTLSKHKYLCGNTFTAADCVLGFTLWWAYTIDQGKLLDGYPMLGVYLNLLQARPAFEKTFGRDEHWDWGQYFRTYMGQLEYL